MILNFVNKMINEEISRLYVLRLNKNPYYIVIICRESLRLPILDHKYYALLF